MSTKRSARVVLALGIAVAAVVVGAGVYLLGVQQGQQTRWHTVTVDLADVAVDGPHRLLSVQADDWTYAIQDGVHWTDRGVFHDRGWPACLEPRHPGFSARNHQDVRLRFAEVAAHADDASWRPVVMVACSG